MGAFLPPFKETAGADLGAFKIFFQRVFLLI